MKLEKLLAIAFKIYAVPVYGLTVAAVLLPLDSNLAMLPALLLFSVIKNFYFALAMGGLIIAMSVHKAIGSNGMSRTIDPALVWPRALTPKQFGAKLLGATSVYLLASFISFASRMDI